MIERTRYPINPPLGERRVRNCLLSPNGIVSYCSFTTHRIEARSIVKHNGYLEEFEKANENKRYDELEFLIIVKGWISIHNGYIRSYQPWTKAQSSKISRYL